MPEEPMMTQAQRDELKKLCLKADVPDKSGELLTQEGAQKYIDDLITQLSSDRNYVSLPVDRCRLAQPLIATPHGKWLG